MMFVSWDKCELSFHAGYIANFLADNLGSRTIEMRGFQFSKRIRMFKKD